MIDDRLDARVFNLYRSNRNTNRRGVHRYMRNDTLGGGHRVVLQQVGQNPHARTVPTEISRRRTPSQLSNGRVGQRVGHGSQHNRRGEC